MAKEQMSHEQRVALGERIKMLIQERGITQAELCEPFGWSSKTMWTWINGEVTPHKYNTSEIAKFFGVDEQWLRYGEGHR